MIIQMCYDFIQFILNMLDLKLSKGGNLFLSFDILNIFVYNNKYTLFISIQNEIWALIKQGHFIKFILN